MAGSNADAGEQQVTFSVKSSSDAKYALTLAAATTVAELKQTLASAEYAGVPPEAQRLIYSGRVLKDGDTLGSAKIKDGNTVHLVKSAASNQRQAPARQGGVAAPPGAAPGPAAAHVPSSIAAGTGAGNPLAQLTGARYAGFHALPGADLFGADGGMGAPPTPDQMLRLLEDPSFAQQMNEAMNNPQVLDMLRNNPMIRNNPMARAAIENPDMRRIMFNPDMIRMQMNMQRAMGGRGAGLDPAFPMPGQTDTTPAADGSTHPHTHPPSPAPPANPFAALFPDAGAPPGDAGGAHAGTGASAPHNPFGSLFGGAPGPSGGPQNPLAASMQQLAQNPALMQQMMQAFGQAGQAAPAAPGAPAGFNPFGALDALGAFGASPEPQGPPDTRPPEERYADQLRQLNDMGFYEFERNVTALRRSGGSVQGAVEYLLTSP